MKRVALAVVVGAVATAHADPAPEPADPPVPGYESGRIDNDPPTASTGRTIARGVLFVPKLAFQVIALPVGGVIYLDDRYKVTEHYKDIFYNHDHTAGLAPAATYSTGFGLTVGAQLFHKDLFGHGEYGAIGGSIGFYGRYAASADLDTGTRLGMWRLEALGDYDRRPEEPFYGFGNTSDEDKIYFKYEESRGGGAVHVDVTPVLHLTALGTYTRLRFSNSHRGPPIDQMFTRAAVFGLDDTTDHVYGELDAAWDTRQAANAWEPGVVHGTGTLVHGWGGRSHQFDGDSFWHYGGEVQEYLRLGFGPQVLLGRVHVEAVSGDITDVPLTEVPYLGGGVFLRGYPYARFRDRIAAVGTAQYMWNVLPYTHAYIFTDVGRVYPRWEDFTLDDLRVGFGVGLEIYTLRDASGGTFVDVAVGSSKDGGVTFMAEFTPMLDARKRWR